MLHRGLFGVSFLAMSLVAAAPVAAQDAVPDQQAPATGSAADAAARSVQSTASDEIVVTATRREERLIDVPIAVTAVSGEQLQNSGVSDIRELVSLAPSVQFQTPGGGSDSSIRIRGIGTTSTNPGLESSVGVVIDGVARARTGVALSELGDLDRIEVLRGPQGTLFGRNTSSGVINIITREPDLHSASGRLEGTYGNYDDRRIAGALNLPLAADTALRVEASGERRDGFYRDANSSKRLDDIDRQFVRAKLLWRPSDTMRWMFSGDFTNRKESCCVALLAIAGPTYNLVNSLARVRGQIGYSSADPRDRQASKNANRRNQEDVRDWGLSAQGDIALGWGDLVSITAYRKWKAHRSQDFDHSGADLGFFAPNGLIQGFNVFTQELRLQGTAHSLDWLVGGYFASERVLNDSAYRIGADYPLIYGGAATFNAATLAAFRAGDGARGIGRQKGRDLSIFTHNILHITGGLSATAGLRYTSNRKRIDYRGENFNPACDVARSVGDGPGTTRFCAPFWDTRFNPAGDSDARTETALTGTGNIAYEFSPNLNTYVSYARGYKSGGYNFDRAGFATPATPNARDLAFRRETVDAFEAGIKAELFDRKLRANLAAFHQVFHGFQLIEYTGINFVVRSLEEAVTKGAELEVTVRPVTGLTLSEGVTYTDAHYPNKVGNRQYANQRMEQAPKYVNVASITYDFPIGEALRGVAYADARYSSRFFTGGFDPNRIQRAFTTANVRFALRDRGDRWSAELWARNVFDQFYFRRVIPATFQAGSYSAFLGDPRTYGATLRFNY